MPEQWPQSYLQSFDPFIADSRSVRYINTLLDKHLQDTSDGFGKTLQLLDVCCGTGHIGRSTDAHLKSLGKLVETTFLDKSHSILKEISLLPTDRLVCSDVISMDDVASESFDVAVCRYGFNNLSQKDWHKALGEVLRVLKPGGVFLLQDHFVPGPVFSALVNEAEQFLAKMEGKQVAPFIFSTEGFNAVLDEHPLVANRIKAGYGLFINIWDRLRAKKELLPDFEAAKSKILHFYEEICLKKYKVLIVDTEEYIHVYNVTYAIKKRV